MVSYRVREDYLGAKLLFPMAVAGNPTRREQHSGSLVIQNCRTANAMGLLCATRLPLPLNDATR
jgi:hypothetical protein